MFQKAVRVRFERQAASRGTTCVMFVSDINAVVLIVLIGSGWRRRGEERRRRGQEAQAIGSGEASRREDGQAAGGRGADQEARGDVDV